jgi:NitT/TauT family transport system permease protein
MPCAFDAITERRPRQLVSWDLTNPPLVEQCSINDERRLTAKFEPVNIDPTRVQSREEEMPAALQRTASLSAKVSTALAAHWRTILSFAMLLVIWEALVRLLGVKLYILPPPSIVLMTLWTKWATIGTAAWYTAQPMLIGYALAVCIGVALALSFALSRWIESIVYPQIVFLQIIPKIAIAPLFMIWFGYGLTSKVLIVFLLSFFPVVVSAVQAFRSMDPDILDLARITGASPIRTFFKVQVPHALPTMFTGFKVAAALASTAAVVAEFVSSDRGLGYLLVDYTNRFDTPGVFAAILVLSIMGLALYAAVEAIERIAIPWHVSQRIDAGIAAAT